MNTAPTVVGYIARHPNKATRLIQSYKNVAAYKNQYIDGCVTVEPVVELRSFDALQKELADVKLRLALAVALHDRLLDENKRLKAPSIFHPAPRRTGMHPALTAPYGGQHA